jgi:hypothetical protein
MRECWLEEPWLLIDGQLVSNADLDVRNDEFVVDDVE